MASTSYSRADSFGRGLQQLSKLHRRASMVCSAVQHPLFADLHKTVQLRSSHYYGNDHHTPRFMAVPAVAHHARCQTPLQTPVDIVQPSHTSISVPLGTVDLYGNYSVMGPAVIRKVNNILVALVQPGGAVSVLCNPEGPMTLSSASLSHDDEEAALCHLQGQHLELDGCYVFQNEREGLKHDGKTIVSVSHLSEDNCITLLPGGSMSHPVNMHPHVKEREQS